MESREVVILGADRKERDLWGRECSGQTCFCHYLRNAPLYYNIFHIVKQVSLMIETLNIFWDECENLGAVGKFGSGKCFLQAVVPAG